MQTAEYPLGARSLVIHTGIMDASPEFTPPVSPGRKERLSDRIYRSRRLNRSYRPTSSEDEPQSETSTDVISNKANGPMDRRDETPSIDVTPSKASPFRRHRGIISMQSPAYPDDESPMMKPKQQQAAQRQQNDQKSASTTVPYTKSPSANKSSRFADKYRHYKKQKDGVQTKQTDENENLPRSPPRPGHKKFVTASPSAAMASSPDKASKLVRSPSGKHHYHRLEVPEKMASPARPTKSKFGSPVTPLRRASPTPKKSALSSRGAASMSPSLRYLSIPSLTSYDEKSPVRSTEKTTDLSSKARGDFKEPTPPKTLAQSIPWPHLSSSASDESSTKKNKFKGVPLPSSVKKALEKQSSASFSFPPLSDVDKLNSPSFERPSASSSVPVVSKQPRASASNPIRSPFETKSGLLSSSRSSSPPVGQKFTTSSHDATTTSVKQSSPVPTASCAEKLGTSKVKPPSPSNPCHSEDTAKEILSPLEQARANLRKTKEPDQSALVPLTPFQQARARLEVGAAGSKNNESKSLDDEKKSKSAEEDEDLKHLTQFQRLRAQMEKKAGNNSTSKAVAPVGTSTSTSATLFPTNKMIADSGSPMDESDSCRPSTPKASAVLNVQVAPSLEEESTAVEDNVKERQEATPAPPVSSRKRWEQTLTEEEAEVEAEAPEGEKMTPPVAPKEKWGQTLNNRFAKTKEKVEAVPEENSTPPVSPKKRSGQTLNNRFNETKEEAEAKHAPVDPPKKKWAQPASSDIVSSPQKNADRTRFSGRGSSVPRACPPEQKKPTFLSPQHKFAKNISGSSSSNSTDEPASTKPMSLVAQARAQLFESPKPKTKQTDQSEQLSAFEQARAAAAANCLKNTKKSTPSEPKPLTPFEQARLNAEAMAGKNPKKVFSPNRPRNKFDAKRQSLGSPEPRPATTLGMAYKDVIAESNSVEVVVRDSEPSVEVNAIEESSQVPTSRKSDAMAGRFTAVQSNKQTVPKMYFTGTPPQKHNSTSSRAQTDSIAKTHSRAESVEVGKSHDHISPPKLVHSSASLSDDSKHEGVIKSAEKWTTTNQEPFRSPLLPPSTSWNQNKAAPLVSNMKTTTTKEPSIVARWKKKVEENREEEQGFSESTEKNGLVAKGGTKIGAKDTVSTEIIDPQEESGTPVVGSVPSWAANLTEINRDGFEKELERCDTDIEIVDATDTSMEKIEVQHLSADRLVIQPSSSPVNRASRPWKEDLVSMSPRKFSDFTASRMEKLRASPKVKPSVCKDGINEEKKDDLSSVGHSASLTDLAVMSIHAVDFENTAQGPIKVTLSSGDEESNSSGEFGSALPSRLPKEFSEALRSSAKGVPCKKDAQSWSDSLTKANEEDGKLVFGEPSTYGEQGDESQKPRPKVSERAKALADWQGGRSGLAKKKPTFTTHAKEILASGDNLVEALQGSDEASSAKKVRTVQDLADQMECWNVAPQLKIDSVPKSNFAVVEWIHRDPDLEELNVTEDQIPDLSPKSQLSPSEAYADEMKDLKSWVGDNETVKNDANDESATWAAFPSQDQVEKVVDPFSLDTSLTFSKATGENKVTFDPAWDTDGFENDFFAGGPNPFAEEVEPFDRQSTDAFATNDPKGCSNKSRGPTPETLDGFWSSQSHDSKRMNISR